LVALLHRSPRTPVLRLAAVQRKDPLRLARRNTHRAIVLRNRQHLLRRRNLPVVARRPIEHPDAREVAIRIAIGCT
jgi:hypothetical protein